MRILHIITRLVRGGAQQNTVMCCGAQVSNGHEVHLAYGPIYGPEGSLLEEAQATGATLHEVPTLLREVQLKVDRQAQRDLRKLIREVQPDVVHTHSSKAGYLGRLAAWAEGVPAVVHTVHGLPFHGRNWPWKNWIYIAAEHRAARKCHAIVGITEAMVKAFRHRLIGRKQQFSVIPSGVDVAEFSLEGEAREQARKEVREKYGIAEDGKVIGIVARLDPYKGHDDIMNMLPRVRQIFPDLKCFFIGDGFYRTQLERRIGFSSLNETIILTGMLSQDEVKKHLAAMDCMVLPSYQEGQGRALVEALLCGCPIVAYRTGGIPEVCIHDQTGKLVRRGNVAGLVKAVTYMLQNPAGAAAMAEAGRQHMIEHFSSQVMFDRLEKLYAELLRQNAPERLEIDA